MALLFSITVKDFKIEDLTSGGKGGQHANRSHTAIRITHPPSGAVGYSADERSQTTNKRKAFLRMAETKKFKDWHKLECARRMGKLGEPEDQVRRQAAFGEGRIRTYHFPEHRVTDERLDKQYPLSPILDGRLEKLIADLISTGRQSGGAA